MPRLRTSRSRTSLRLTVHFAKRLAFFDERFRRKEFVGVIEAISPSGELYGFHRPLTIGNQPAKAISTAVLQFGQEDEITVLTVVRVATEELASV